ncbi:hypothetical protein BJY18_007123 [Amycolatopsis jiangsuensis]|uniref:Uncharacterized protein n=2 Tax=Amycolatopsis jiangsuensis TaxID=1181879 RepID=A0A840J8C7_9PSEU|nr:hypothetical protein [Amycolatopsis jiangsuensis]
MLFTTDHPHTLPVHTADSEADSRKLAELAKLSRAMTGTTVAGHRCRAMSSSARSSVSSTEDEAKR